MKRAPVFTFKCIFCQSKNDTTKPPIDNMLNCKACGYPTPHTLHKVKK